MITLQRAIRADDIVNIFQPQRGNPPEPELSANLYDTSKDLRLRGNQVNAVAESLCDMLPIAPGVGPLKYSGCAANVVLVEKIWKLIECDLWKLSNLWLLTGAIELSDVADVDTQHFALETVLLELR